MKTVVMNVTRPISQTASHIKGATVTIDDDLADFYIGTGAARYATVQQADARLLRRASDGVAISVVGAGGDLAGVNVTADVNGNPVLVGADGNTYPVKGSRSVLLRYIDSGFLLREMAAPVRGLRKQSLRPHQGRALRTTT